jgi:hypothetical protein
VKIAIKSRLAVKSQWSDDRRIGVGGVPYGLFYNFTALLAHVILCEKGSG